MKNIFIILFALIWTVTHIDDSKAQVSPLKDRVVYWHGTLDTISPRIEYDRWTGYLTANESTHQLTFRDPITGLPSIGWGINLPISTAQASVNTLKANIASPTFTGTVTVPTPSTSGSATTKGYVDAAIAAFPIAKRQETYSVTTNASGVASVTFSTVYAVAPNIQINPTNFSSDNQFARVTAITTTGFTVLCRLRTDLVGLLPTFSNINGATVDILITAK